MKQKLSIDLKKRASEQISDTHNNKTLPINRYRQSSLPPPLKPLKSDNQLVSQIYFDRQKKSRFMKNIVDGYFEQDHEKINKSSEFEVKKIISDIRNVVKRGKNGYFQSGQSSPPKEVVRSMQTTLISKRRSLQKNLQELPSKKIVMFADEINNGTESLYFTSSTNISQNNTFLPPIEEMNQEIAGNYGSVQYRSSLDQTSLKFPELNSTIELNIEPDKKNEVLVYQNQAFKIFILHENEKPTYRMKEFKGPGIEILKRQERVRNMGIQTLWKESLINANCFLSPLVHPIKNLICKILPNLQNNGSKTGSNPVCKFKVKSTTFRRYLLANDCLQLKHLMRQICLTLKKLQGRVLNNKINPSNIFMMKSKVVLGQWGYSSFRDEYEIQTNKFESRVHPILKSQTEWLTTPEYLSPQILLAVSAKNQDQEPDIWENSCASDIWSLGLTIFQIISMIPLWINDHCLIRYAYSKKTTSSSPNKTSVKLDPQIHQTPIMRPRKGLLATDDRKIEKIVEKQKNLNSHIRRTLNTQIQQKIDETILSIVRRMVMFDPSERITLDQILSQLK